MAVTIDGTTGVSLVQDGVITDANLPAGSVLQVVSATDSTEVSTTSTSYQTTSVSASITPTSTSSTILVLCTVCAENAGSGSNADFLGFALYRDSTQVFQLNEDARLDTRHSGTGGPTINNAYPLIFEDSPASTSAISYNIRFRSRDAQTVTVNDRNRN
jgi:hypothetical protein